MLDILRDSAWQFAGVLLALAALPFAYWLYLLQRKYKEVAFGVISKRALLSVDKNIAQRVQVTLDNRPVEDVYMIVLGLKNSGNTSILPEDFVRPLTVNFLPDSRVISCTIAKQNPGNLGANVVSSRC